MLDPVIAPSLELWSCVAKVLTIAPEATRIQSGYFATVKDPLQPFRCRPAPWCPGGMPGLVCKGLQNSAVSGCVPPGVSRSAVSTIHVSYFILFRAIPADEGSFSRL